MRTRRKPLRAQKTGRDVRETAETAQREELDREARVLGILLGKQANEGLAVRAAQVKPNA